MRKIVRTTLPLQHGRLHRGKAHQDYLKLTIKPDALKDWIACLCLLRTGLVDSFVFWDASDGGKIEVRSGEPTGWDWKGGGRSFKIALADAWLDDLLGFLAVYYRDGVSGVDHIDIETDNPPGGYIVVMVEECSPPISMDEFDRLMREGPT